ncbi:hypothetical protein FRB99_004944 [Tulasnella sp. 403]|nr:hypothetical protein FRB99_004944 [Tulasnella sp. 403]
MNSDHLLAEFLNVDDNAIDNNTVLTPTSSLWVHPPFAQVKPEDVNIDDGWSRLVFDPAHSVVNSPDYDSTTPVATTPSSIASSSCIPGGLSQISFSSTSRSPSPDMSGTFVSPPPAPAPRQPTLPTVALNPSSLHTRALTPPLVTNPSNPKRECSIGPHTGQPHPYSISPTNTTALFTRASSAAAVSGKKSRAPPSGPISTKDFIPPDVSGLSKREARLVKNRAAAFLSRQRKREEFEGLEARVEVLEADNARLYKELEAYRSGPPPGPATPNPATANANSGALQAEIAGLKRQLAARDAELSKMHSRLRSLVGVQEQLAAEKEHGAEREKEIDDLKRRVAVAETKIKRDEESDSSDSEDAQSTIVGDVKKDSRGAGSVALMVLLFSLSTLLSNGPNGSTTPSSTIAPQRVRRASLTSESRPETFLGFPDCFGGFGSFDSMMLPSPSFGFDEDSLLSMPAAPTSALSPGGLSAASAFAGLAPGVASSSVMSTPLSTHAELKDSATLQRAISSVKAINSEEFEFDFAAPSSKEKKVRVCVKSSVPLNLDLGSLNEMGFPVHNAKDLFHDEPEADLFTFGESRKRKRVTVEIEPTSVRRKLSATPESEEERWDVRFSEDMTAFGDDEDEQYLRMGL